jgi:hypothetical protein
MITPSRAIVVIPTREARRRDAARGADSLLIEETVSSAGPGSASDERKPARSTHGTLASFVAHVIATDQMWPQTRARARANPSVASAAYRAAARRS